MAVGRRLKALRKHNAVSMNKVHLDTRMSTSYLSKLEDDRFVPGKPNLEKIVEALKENGVADADVLYEEHAAVMRERKALEEVQELLAEMDLQTRLRRIEEIVETAKAGT